MKYFICIEMYSKYGDQKLPAIIDIEDGKTGDEILAIAQEYADDYVRANGFATSTIIQLNRI